VITGIVPFFIVPVLIISFPDQKNSPGQKNPLLKRIYSGIHGVERGADYAIVT